MQSNIESDDSEEYFDAEDSTPNRLVKYDMYSFIIMQRPIIIIIVKWLFNAFAFLFFSS